MLCLSYSVALAFAQRCAEQGVCAARHGQNNAKTTLTPVHTPYAQQWPACMHRRPVQQPTTHPLSKSGNHTSEAQCLSGAQRSEHGLARARGLSHTKYIPHLPPKGVYPDALPRAIPDCLDLRNRTTYDMLLRCVAFCALCCVCLLFSGLILKPLS